MRIATIFLLLFCHINIAYCQDAKEGIVLYQVTPKPQSTKNVAAPQNVLNNISVLGLTGTFKSVFKAEKSVFHLAGEDDLLEDLKEMYSYSYRNTKTGTGYFVEKKFSKLLKKVENNPNVFVKVTNRHATICGYYCTEIIYKNAAHNDLHAWATSRLPTGAGCIIIKNLTSAVLRYDDKKVITEAQKLTTRSIATEYFSPLNKAETVKADENTNTVKGSKCNVSVGNKFGQYQLTDIKGATYTEQNLQGNITALVLWDDFDLAGFWKDSEFKMTRSCMTLLQELDNFARKSDSRIKIIAPVFVSKAEVLKTHPTAAQLTNVKIVANAKDWIMNGLNIRSYPTVVLIDKKGIIRKVINYYNTGQQSLDIQQQLNGLLKELQ